MVVSPTTTAQDTRLTTCAREVWEVMQRESVNHGLALIRDKRLGDGRVLVATIGAFIKGLSKERDWDLDDTEIDAVRRYLKATGNVVALTKVEQYRFRIFVRETWSDTLLVSEKDPNRVGPAPEDKVTPEEAGETREPAPVVFKCVDCGAGFVNQNALNGHRAHCQQKPRPAPRPEPESDTAKVARRLGAAQLGILQALHDAGGKVVNGKGRVATDLAELADLDVQAVSRAMRTLTNYKLTTRDVNGKRTYRASLTDAGREALRHRTSTRPAPAVRTVKQPEPQPEPEQQAAATNGTSHDVPLREASARLLLDELTDRFVRTNTSLAQGRQLRDRLDLIRDLVAEVNAGSLAPLKALADIEAALDL